MKTNYLVMLLLILLFSFVIRIIVINYAWIDTDEGNYIYDAKLLAEGNKPFEDFYMKDLLYVAVLALFGKIFGFSLFIGKLISVVLSMVTILFIYKIGAEIYGQKEGIVAAIIYAFMPFAIFWNSLTREYILMIMLVSIAVYCAIRFVKTEKLYYASLNSFFMLLALLTRRSMILLIFAELILFLYLYKTRIRLLLNMLLHSLFGIVLPLLIIFLYSYFYDINFLKLIGFEFSLYQDSFSWQQFFGLRAVLPYWFFREGSYIIALGLIFFGAMLNKARKILIYGSFLSIFASSIIFEYLVAKFPERMSQYPITSSLFFVFSLIYMAVLFLLVRYKLKEDIRIAKPNVFMLAWFLSIMVFYFFYIRWHVVYFAEIMPPISILFAPLLIDIWHKRTNLNKIIIAALFIGIIFSLVFYINYHGISNKWPPNEINEISQYIKDNSNSNDEMLTPMVFIPLQANRGLALNITHPLFYHFEGAGDKDDVGVPSFKTIIDYMERNKVKYVVSSNQMDVTYYALKPDLKLYIENNYLLEKKIGDVEILVRKAG